MKIIVKQRALNSIINAAQYVENLNTIGSGERWMNKLEAKIILLASAKVKVAFCNHPWLSKYKFRCLPWKDWIIVYRISETKFEVCRFIYAPLLP